MFAGVKVRFYHLREGVLRDMLEVALLFEELSILVTSTYVGAQFYSRHHIIVSVPACKEREESKGDGDSIIERIETGF